MKKILRNWKTSLFGLASIVTGVALVVSGNFADGGTAILAGITGLLAKDSDVSGRP